MERIDSRKVKRANRLIIFLLVFFYMLISMSDNFKGIFIPLFKEDFQISNVKIGYVVTVSLTAYAIFQYIGGLLIEKLGFKLVFAIGFFCSITSLLCIYFSRSYAALLVGLSVLNAGMGLFNIGVSTLGPALSVSSAVILMNLFNVVYGASTTILQKATGFLLANAVPWHTIYGFMLLFCVGVFIYFLFVRIPYGAARPKEISPNAGYQKRDLIRNKMLYLYIAAIGFYLGSEFSIGNWFINYMSEVYHLDADRRSSYIAMYWGIETFGRLIGGFIVERVGHFKSITIYGVLGVLCSASGILLGQTGLLFLSLAGLFYSIIYPTLIVTIRHAFGNAASYATGIILMCGTLFSMLINLLLGIANDYVGVRPAYSIVTICLALCVVTSLLIWRNMPRESSGRPDVPEN